jgi:hypothetical protein
MPFPVLCQAARSGTAGSLSQFAIRSAKALRTDCSGSPQLGEPSEPIRTTCKSRNPDQVCGNASLPLDPGTPVPLRMPLSRLTMEFSRGAGGAKRRVRRRLERLVRRHAAFRLECRTQPIKTSRTPRPRMLSSTRLLPCPGTTLKTLPSIVVPCIHAQSSTGRRSETGDKSSTPMNATMHPTRIRKALIPRP